MIEKRIEDIQKLDIDHLVQRKKAERRTLEYKAELPLGTPNSRYGCNRTCLLCQLRGGWQAPELLERQTATNRS